MGLRMVKAGAAFAAMGLIVVLGGCVGLGAHKGTHCFDAVLVPVASSVVCETDGAVGGYLRVYGTGQDEHAGIVEDVPLHEHHGCYEAVAGRAATIFCPDAQAGLLTVAGYSLDHMKSPEIVAARYHAIY